jgi:CRISPR-associated protein (TIGR03984 family)
MYQTGAESMKEKALELNFIKKKSSAKTCKQYNLSDFPSFEALAHDKFGELGFCVFYLDNKVLFGKYDGASFLFYNNDLPKPEHMQKMRLFNRDKELLLWKKQWKERSGDFAYRLRVDEEGDNTDAIDAMQVLWGTKANSLDENFTELSEKRGMKIIVPLKGVEVDDGEKRLFILTRNYITYKTDGPETHDSEADGCPKIAAMTREKISETHEPETDDPSYMQASYFDCRFVSFIDKDGRFLGW